MNISVLKSKIHRAIITEANLNYVGSLTLDEDLMEAANLIENEKVQIVNVNNGERIETYLIKEREVQASVALMDRLHERAPSATWSSSSLIVLWTLKKRRLLSPGWSFQKMVTAFNFLFYQGHRLIDY